MSCSGLLSKEKESLMWLAVWQLLNRHCTNQCTWISWKIYTVSEHCIGWKKNDPDLTAVRLGWPLPSESVLRDVLNAIASHSTIERVDIVMGEYHILPWWSGKETLILELLKSALAENTSIMDIRVKERTDSIIDDHIIEILQHCQQLESLSFKVHYI